MAKSKVTDSAPDAPLSLEEWVEGAKQGNEDDFARVAKHFTPALVSMVSLLDVPKAEEEDLMQEGFIGLYKAVCLFDPSLSSFGTFARICMRSSLLDWVKKSQKKAPSVEIENWEEVLSASPAQGPERILMRKEEIRELLEKVECSLSPMEKRIFALRLSGKKAPEIGSILGKEAKSVENALYRLRKKLSQGV